MSKICRNCGNTLNDNDAVCTRCGFGAPVSSPSAGWTPVRICMLVAAALLIICTFLPYASANVFGVSFSQSLLKGGDGIFFIIVAVLCIVFTLINKPILELIFGAVACALSIFELISWNKQVGELGQYSSLISKGIGFYLMFIASIALLILGLIRLLQSNK